MAEKDDAKDDKKKTLSSKDKVTLQPLSKADKPEETEPEETPAAAEADTNADADDSAESKPDDQLTPIDIEDKNAKEARKKQEAEAKEFEKVKGLINSKKYFLPIKGKR